MDPSASIYPKTRAVRYMVSFLVDLRKGGGGPFLSAWNIYLGRPWAQFLSLWAQLRHEFHSSWSLAQLWNPWFAGCSFVPRKRVGAGEGFLHVHQKDSRGTVNLLQTEGS